MGKLAKSFSILVKPPSPLYGALISLMFSFACLCWHLLYSYRSNLMSVGIPIFCFVTFHIGLAIYAYLFGPISCCNDRCGCISLKCCGCLSDSFLLTVFNMAAYEFSKKYQYIDFVVVFFCYFYGIYWFFFHIMATPNVNFVASYTCLSASIVIAYMFFRNQFFSVIVIIFLFISGCITVYVQYYLDEIQQYVDGTTTDGGEIALTN